MSVAYLDGGATLSADRVYRYHLWRVLSERPGRLLFVMCNPSTADETLPDPTITRCAGFAAREGVGVFDVVNLWAYRSKNPRELARAVDPIGEDNDAFIRTLASECTRIVAAWGDCVRKAPAWRERVADVVQMLAETEKDIECFGLCRDASTPRHPLMLRADTKLVALP